MPQNGPANFYIQYSYKLYTAINDSYNHGSNTVTMSTWPATLASQEPQPADAAGATEFDRIGKELAAKETGVPEPGTDSKSKSQSVESDEISCHHRTIARAAKSCIIDSYIQATGCGCG